MSLAQFINVLLPEIILMMGACVVLFFRGEGRRTGAGGYSLIVIGLALFATLIQGELGLTTPGFEVAAGVATGALSDFVRVLTLVVGALLVCVNWHQPAAGERNEYFSMLLLAMSGVTLLSVANDLVLLFFALELVSVPTYVLVALSRRDIRAQEACSKYFFLGAMAAGLLAYGLSFLYGAGGTTTMFGAGSLDAVLSGPSLEGYALLGVLLTVGALCFKIAAVPFHAYVADVYEGAAAPLAAALAFLPKLAGLVALMQVLALVSWPLTPGVPMDPTVFWALWVIAALTMTVGNVLALMQTNIKRLLAYSSVAHSGYMLIGLVVGPPSNQAGPLADGLAAVLFYMAVYGVMNLGAFTFVACLSREESEAAEPGHIKGCAKHHPIAAAGLAVCMFSLVGLPPTAGFMGKVYLFSSAFSGGEDSLAGALVALAVVAAINSAIGAAYYLRVVGWCYCEPAGRDAPGRARAGLQVGLVLCAALVLSVFLWPRGLHDAAARATEPRSGWLAADPAPAADDLAASEPRP